MNFNLVLPLEKIEKNLRQDLYLKFLEYEYVSCDIYVENTALVVKLIFIF